MLDIVREIDLDHRYEIDGIAKAEELEMAKMK